MLLAELTESVRTLKGIGPANAAAMSGIGIRTIADLLLHSPRSYEDRKTIVTLSAVGADGTANTEIVVVEHDHFYWNGRRTLKAIVTDSTAPAALVCFGREFLERLLEPGRRFRLYGKFQLRHGELQSSSFTVEPVDSPPVEFGMLLPVYPLTAKLTQKTLRRATARAIAAYCPGVDDELPETLRHRRGVLRCAEAIASLHYPDSLADADVARKSLAYRELFYLQLVVRRRSAARPTGRRRARSIDPGRAERLLARLSFSLTPDQKTVYAEIARDLGSPVAMTRLLQGDVGSGKTLIALLAAALVASAGEQTAIMVPTELLARQQAEAAARLLEPVGLSVGFYSGSVTGAPRRRLLEAIASGEVDVVVGTHALFGEGVHFRALGLAVIDEQHRFGVLQRLSIVEKGDAPDLLLMTATPIPRSLALTVFGDLDTSTIRTMPAGRLPVRTHLARRGNERKVYERVRRELEAGHQAYFVYPLIEESQALDLKNAEGMHDELAGTIFPDYRVALIHSRIDETVKRETMRSFASGEIDVLVATSVVEVGVDVANATCMVIEHAERFGLAALHQLRGRVGRSSVQSYAFLVYDREITEIAKRRLLVMKETTDGFRLAEEDLRMRGPGELTGTHQTGELELRFADIVRDSQMLTESRDDVLELLRTDPGLLAPENRPVREVMSRRPPFTDRTAAAG
jgi:ATP-dependent DNA helicase RecG